MSDDQTPMIDVLAFNCSTLHRDLWGADDEKIKEELIFKYLTNIDKEFSTIPWVKDGRFIPRILVNKAH